jgi:hypothetical protein
MHDPAAHLLAEEDQVGGGEHGDRAGDEHHEPPPGEGQASDKTAGSQQGPGVFGCRGVDDLAVCNDGLSRRRSILVS